MLVTALSAAHRLRRGGRRSRSARTARALTLREAALASGRVTAEDFDRIVDPLRMTEPGLDG